MWGRTSTYTHHPRDVDVPAWDGRARVLRRRSRCEKSHPKEMPLVVGRDLGFPRKSLSRRRRTAGRRPRRDGIVGRLIVISNDLFSGGTN